eukprot:2982529-Amphidinium_carterae.1
MLFRATLIALVAARLCIFAISGGFWYTPQTFRTAANHFAVAGLDHSGGRGKHGEQQTHYVEHAGALGAKAELIETLQPFPNLAKADEVSGGRELQLGVTQDA